jgi:hypothetical protein
MSEISALSVPRDGRLLHPLSLCSMTHLGHSLPKELLPSSRSTTASILSREKRKATVKSQVLNSLYTTTIRVLWHVFAQMKMWLSYRKVTSHKLCILTNYTRRKYHCLIWYTHRILNSYSTDISLGWDVQTWITIRSVSSLFFFLWGYIPNWGLGLPP